jgi:hypothetical protein
MQNYNTLYYKLPTVIYLYIICQTLFNLVIIEHFRVRIYVTVKNIFIMYIFFF